MSCFELCFFNVHAKYLPEGFRSQAGSIVIVKVSLAQGRCQNAHAYPLHNSSSYETEEIKGVDKGGGGGVGG